MRVVSASLCLASFTRRYSGDPDTNKVVFFWLKIGEENAVALKLPTFWTSQPQVWFSQTEAQFALQKITVNETQYYHVLAALDQATATRVLDLISAPPPPPPPNRC